MVNTTNAFKTAIAQPSRTLKSRFTIGANTITDDYIQGIVHDNAVITGDDFETGTAVMATVSIDLFDKDNTLSYAFENQEVNIEIATKLADTTFEYISLGLFIIEKATRDNKKIKLAGCDRMYKFEKDYISTLTYPATLLQIAQDICSKAGVTLKNTSFVNSAYSVGSQPVLDGITLRKAISQVAELAGGYARITRDGKLEIVNISNTSAATITKSNYIDFNNKDLVLASIDKVVVKLGTEQATSGTGTNPYYIVDNMFCQNPNSVVTALYTALNGISYMPYNMRWQGNPALECGDKIAVVTDKGTYNTIIGSKKLTYRGGLREEYKAPGKSNTEKSSTGKGNLIIDIENAKTEIKILKGQIIQKVSSDDVKSIIEQNPENIKIGFNSISDRIVMSDLGISIKEGGLELLAENGDILGWFGSAGGGFSKLRVNELIADNVLTIQTTNMTLYVDGTSGNDNNAGTTGSKLKTITCALSKINKIFKSGVSCYIYVSGVCSENVLVENFMGDGYLGIILDPTSTLNGSIKNAGCSCFVDVKGGRDGWNSSVLGALIQPPVGKPAVESINSRFVQVYGCRTKVSNADGFVWDGCNGSAIFNDISGTLTGTNRSAISAVNGAQVTMWNNRGSDNWFAWAAEWGGAIISTDGCGVPNNSYGIGIGTGGRSLVGTTTAGESSDPSVRPPTQTYTTQWVATQTDSYRPSGWRTDTNNIYQGEWSGNGIHTGFMCFDSAAIRAELAGATINNVRIYMTRYNGGGASAATPLHWRGHGYDATGGGTAITSDFGYNGALGWGQAGWIGLPTSVGDQLKADTIRGLALYDGSSNYSIYTGLPTLEITYTK